MNILNRIENWKWRTLKQLGLTNIRVNRLLRRADDESIRRLDVPVSQLNITPEEYAVALASDRLAFYRSLPFAHRKVLEYLTSVRLSASIGEIASLCDFAGGMDPFAAWARERRAPGATIYAVDPSLVGGTRDDITHVRGDARQIDLADESLDWITCHHSIEHFQEDMDTTAVKEFARILRPGGLAVITPIFLVNDYAEIWNARRWRSSSFDPRARRIVDYTSPFPGWSEFEHFARAYDVTAFRDRILNALIPHGSVELFEVQYNGKACPDVTVNKGLPAFCERMLSLRFTKSTRR